MVNTGDRTEHINLVVRPAADEGTEATGFFLVLFEEARDRDAAPLPQPTALEPGLRQLEEELIRIKAQMRGTIEQYEIQAEEAKAANEELQAMNEELRSTAEELETSQEELQSVNEELQTVNQELKVKIDEITHASDDLRNFMSSTEIGTVFVDRSLRVKLFTPRVRDIFNLIPGDIGRPLLDLTNKLAMDDLSELMGRVLDRLQTIEREVQTRDGGWFLMRMLPYRTSEDRIDGVVVTFLDITERHKAEEALRASELKHRELFNLTNAITNLVPDLLWMSEPNGETNWYNNRWLDYTGQTLAQASGWGWLDVIHPEDRERSAAAYAHAVERAKPLQQEYRVRSKSGEYHWFLVNAEPLLDEQGKVVRFYGAATDIHEQRVAREELEQRVRERTKQLEELSAQRQQLLERLVSAEEHERQRLARELHDEMGQHITALKVALETLPSSDVVGRMQSIVASLDNTIDRLTIELRPPVLDDMGLQGALSSLAEQFTAASGITADVHATIGDGRLPEAVETTLYRVVQEALTNVWKHAAAKNVSIIVKRADSQVQLIIEDDGKGFDADVPRAASTFGLLGMRERVTLIGGTMSIESGSGNGTALYVRVPLPAQE